MASTSRKNRASEWLVIRCAAALATALLLGLLLPWWIGAPAGLLAGFLVPSALLAGLFLVLADIGVRLLPTDSELKLGVVAALVGAPVFVAIAARRRTGA